jgi:hypothetical protein
MIQNKKSDANLRFQQTCSRYIITLSQDVRILLWVDEMHEQSAMATYLYA